MAEGANKLPVHVGGEITSEVFHALHRMMFVRRVVGAGFSNTIVDWDSGATYNRADIVHKSGFYFAWKDSTPGNHDPTATDGGTYWRLSVGHRFSSWLGNAGTSLTLADGTVVNLSDIRPPVIGAYEVIAGYDYWTAGEWAAGSLCRYQNGGLWYTPTYNYRAKANTTHAPADSSGSVHSTWERLKYREEIGTRDLISAGVGTHIGSDVVGANMSLSYQAAVEYIAKMWHGQRGVDPLLVIGSDWVSWAETQAIPVLPEYGRGGQRGIKEGGKLYTSEVITAAGDPAPPHNMWKEVELTECNESRRSRLFKCMDNEFEKSLDELGDFDMMLDAAGYPVFVPGFGDTCGLGADCPDLQIGDEEDEYRQPLRDQQTAYEMHEAHPVWRRCWKHTMGRKRWRAGVHYEVGTIVTHVYPSGNTYEHQVCIEHTSTAANAPHLSNLEIDEETGVWSAADYAIPVDYPYHEGLGTGGIIKRYWFVQTARVIDGWVWGDDDNWVEHYDSARVERHSHVEIPAKIVNDMYNVLLTCDTATSGGGISYYAAGSTSSTYGTEQEAVDAARADLLTQIAAENWLGVSWPYILPIGIEAYDYSEGEDPEWEASAFALAAVTWSDVATRLYELGITMHSKVNILYASILQKYATSQPAVNCNAGITIPAISRIWSDGGRDAYREIKDTAMLNVPHDPTEGLENYHVIIPNAEANKSFVWNSNFEAHSLPVLVMDWDEITGVLADV